MNTAQRASSDAEPLEEPTRTREATRPVRVRVLASPLKPLGVGGYSRKQKKETYTSFMPIVVPIVFPLREMGLTLVVERKFIYSR